MSSSTRVDPLPCWKSNPSPRNSIPTVAAGSTWLPLEAPTDPVALMGIDLRDTQSLADARAHLRGRLGREHEPDLPRVRQHPLDEASCDRSTHAERLSLAGASGVEREPRGSRGFPVRDRTPARSRVRPARV